MAAVYAIKAIDAHSKCIYKQYAVIIMMKIVIRRRESIFVIYLIVFCRDKVGDAGGR